MIEKDFDNNNENVIEFLTGQRKAGVTLTQQKMKNHVLELSKKYPNEIKDLYINRDTSISCTVPLSWIKITPPRHRNLSEEQKAKISERLKAGREKNLKAKKKRK